MFRLEIRTPNIRFYQITCINFNKLGFFNKEKIIKIEQIVKVSGQKGTEVNQRIREVTCELLENKGLLTRSEEKAERWSVGTYNSQKNEWICGQNTDGFIKNFLKVAIIMAHARGNRRFSLLGCDEFYNDINQPKSNPSVKFKKTISPEQFKNIREEWERIGLTGEIYVLSKEKQKLAAEGRIDLMEKVKHISFEDCAAGYDILSFELDGRPRYIECKTTTGEKNSFEISANEWETARRYREQYYIYRVEQINDEPIIKKIQDSFGLAETEELKIKPSAFVINLK